MGDRYNGTFVTLSLATKCVYMPDAVDSVTGAVNTPIYQTAGFAYPNPADLENVFKGRDSGHVYSRISNPTIADLERRIAYLDNALGAVAFSSGLAAIFTTIMVLARSGQNIVVSNALFSGSRDLFDETIPQLGIDVRWVDITDHNHIKALIDDQTAAVFSEIISNPKLVIPDVKALVDGIGSIPLVIDATLTGSTGFDAVAHNVAVVIYSSTKLFASNTGAIGGIVVDTGCFNWGQARHPDVRSAYDRIRGFAFIERLRRHGLNNGGFNTSPMNAFLTLVGLETLALRYERICQTAQTVAAFFDKLGIPVRYPGLATHPQHALANELLTGFGPLMTIDLGTKERAFAFISKLKIVKNMTNLGDNRTMVIHPKSTLYWRHDTERLQQAGVTDGLIRMTIGLESPDDLIHEFKEALQ